MSTELIKELRARTGAGVLDCKKALAEAGSDLDAAADWLRAKGIASAAKKAGRIAAEGVVASYIHGGGRIGVLLEVNSETDFVARTDAFKELVEGLSMHIAASNPRYVSKDDVPAADVAAERAVQIERVVNEGKPAAVAEKIVDGRMGKWYEEVCLLEQDYALDSDKTVGTMIAEAIGRIGENLRVRRFVRYEVGEGLEKRSEDFAAEVARQTAGV